MNDQEPEVQPAPPQPVVSLEMMGLMQAAQTAAQGFVKQAESAVPLEQERTRQLEIRSRYEHEKLRWEAAILILLLLAVAGAVGFSLSHGQWWIASHLLTAVLAFLAGRRGVKPSQPGSPQGPTGPG